MDRRQPTFLDNINSGMSSPLFQFGANLFAGSAQGNPGQGVANGASAASQAQQRNQVQQRQMAEFQAEQQRLGQAQAEKAQKDKLFLEAISGADPKMRPLLQTIGPQAAGKFLLDQMADKDGGGKVMNVGGNLVRLGPGGKPEVIYNSPESSRPINVDGNLVRVGPDGKAEFIYRKPPSIAEQFMSGMAPGQPQARPPQPQGGVIQQSNPVQPGSDPNLQLTAGGQQPQPQVQPPPQQDMVTLPNGQAIPRQQAEQLRFGLALEGNKAAVDALDGVINPASEQIGEAASNLIDKSLFDSGNMLQRLSGIKDTFKREYMGWGNRLGNLGLDIVGRIDPTALSEDQRSGVQEYAKFRRAAAENVNRYIKEITGAQMSEAEAQRLMLAAPNAGQGIFDGDGPDTFIGKIQDIERTTKLSMARMYYLKKNGFKPTRDENGYISNLPMELEDTAEIIQQRTRQLQQRARAEGVPDAQMRPWVQQNLKQEFGI